MNRINELRLRKGKSMMQAAKELEIPYTTFVNYEKGDREPNSEMLIKLADYFETSVDYLICRSDEEKVETLLFAKGEIIPLPKTKEVPLLGTIACGEPILAIENIEMFI